MRFAQSDIPLIVSDAIIINPKRAGKVLNGTRHYSALTELQLMQLSAICSAYVEDHRVRAAKRWQHTGLSELIDSPYTVKGTSRQARKAQALEMCKQFADPDAFEEYSSAERWNFLDEYEWFLYPEHYDAAKDCGFIKQISTRDDHNYDGPIGSEVPQVPVFAFDTEVVMNDGYMSVEKILEKTLEAQAFVTKPELVVTPDKVRREHFVSSVKFNKGEEVLPRSYPMLHYSDCKFFLNDNHEVVINQDKYDDYFRGRKYYMSHTNRGESDEPIPRQLEKAKARQEFLRSVDVRAIELVKYPLSEQRIAKLNWGKGSNQIDRTKKFGNVTRIVRMENGETYFFYSRQVFEAFLRKACAMHSVPAHEFNWQDANDCAVEFVIDEENGNLVPVPPKEQSYFDWSRLGISKVYWFRKGFKDAGDAHRANFEVQTIIDRSKVFRVTCDVLTTSGNVKY